MSPRQRRKRRRPRIGDVLEIATPQGFAYAQFTHDHPMEGELLRILPGLYATRPADLAALVQQPERYVTFYALRAILSDDEVTVVGGARCRRWPSWASSRCLRATAPFHSFARPAYRTGSPARYALGGFGMEISIPG